MNMKSQGEAMRTDSCLVEPVNWGFYGYKIPEAGGLEFAGSRFMYIKGTVS